MNSSLALRSTPLDGLMVLERKISFDRRGSFSRLICTEALHSLGLDMLVVQVNHSVNHRRGTVRGMHYQVPPHTETKCVNVLRGTVFDVAIDLRSESPTFLKWHAEILSAENARAMVIPRGYAHGFQTLTDNCELIYAHSALYAPDAERALNIRDPRINIFWPLEIAELSERDASHPFISSDFLGVMI